MVSDGRQSPADAPIRAARGTIGRRTLISGTALVAVLSVAGSGWLCSAKGFAATALPASEPPAEFLAISRLLTGHANINPALAGPAWDALCRREQAFEARFTALSGAVSAAGLHDMTAWKASPVAADAALKATAVAIVSAWYLGRVGAVKTQSEDGPAFITYDGALMWRPTFDVTVIPTYARGGPGYWAAKPAAVTV